VGVVYPSDFIGRPFGGTTNHGVTALTDARVCVFSRVDFDGFARKHPELEHKLLQRTLGELDRTRRWMLLLGRKSASEKVASFLIELSDRLAPLTCEGEGDGIAARFHLPFSRQQIADVLGLTIETVSRQFTRLKNEGLIDLPSRREVVIADRHALIAEAKLGRRSSRSHNVFRRNGSGADDAFSAICAAVHASAAQPFACGARRCSWPNPMRETVGAGPHLFRSDS
jgi:CRP/FNR family transcriptional regulator